MTPIRPSDFRSRSRLNARDHKRDEACPEGTPRCLCRKLAELYESGRLKLYRGTVSRARLEDHLGLGRNTLSPKARAAPQEAPGRCLRRFDQLLESWGHGTVWTEKIPAIRRVLEARKAAGTLPVNERGNLNRTEILREFGVGDGSVHVIQRRAPKLQAVLDAYDTTRDDPAYTAYKHDVLETRLKKVLASREPKLTHGRIVSPKWLADRLGVTPATLTSTPKLNDLIEEKQREIDRQLRQGRTRKSFRVGGASHINLGARPYSKTHKRAFDFSGLVPDYGLEYAEKIGTVFVAVSEEVRLIPKVPLPQNPALPGLAWKSDHPATLQSQSAAEVAPDSRTQQSSNALRSCTSRSSPTRRAQTSTRTRDRLTLHCRLSRSSGKRGCSLVCGFHVQREKNSGEQTLHDRASQKHVRWSRTRRRSCRFAQYRDIEFSSRQRRNRIFGDFGDRTVQARRPAERASRGDPDVVRGALGPAAKRGVAGL